jgi:MoaA/NifB/PqqE/SkfB family radical SAM enzyme
MGKKLSFVKHVLTGSSKFCEFALNNICTAKCKFCSIWKQKEKFSVDSEKALAAISHLATLDLDMITLTGGEPMLHPDFDKIVQRCTDHNITSSILVADARLLTEKRLDALEKAEVDLVSISVDHHTNKVASESRSIPDILVHIEKGVKELRKRKINTMASTLLCTFNHKSMDKLFEKCEAMGFDQISVNYPEFSESPVYTLGGSAIDLTKEEIIEGLEEVKRLKKKHLIINSKISLDNIITFLKGDTPKYLCLGGSKTFFIDWNFNVYPCMHHGRDMGDVLALKKSDFVQEPCNDCNMSWYRDISIYFQGPKSILPLISAIPLVTRL